MFSVYFDESGTHRASPVVVVAGWVSTDIQWRAFSTSWQKILRVAGLTPPVFHMTDFESRRPPFSDWKNSKRIKVLQRLHGQIRRRARKPIIAAVLVDAYEKAKRERKVPSELSPYGFAVMECVKKVGAWADETGHKESIAYYFEDVSLGRGEVVLAMSRLEINPDFRARFRYGSWGFGFKDEMVPLQAADMLAYEIWKEAINGNLASGKDRQRPLRKSLRAIVDIVPQFSYYGPRAFDSATPLTRGEG